MTISYFFIFKSADNLDAIIPEIRQIIQGKYLVGKNIRSKILELGFSGPSRFAIRADLKIFITLFSENLN